MLLSFDQHQWSSDGNTWIAPQYHHQNLGGSARGWPTDGRNYLPFWGDGSINGKGGFYDGHWKKPFQLFYVTGTIDFYSRKG